MSLLQKQKKQTVLYLERQYIMHIQVDGSWHFWTAHFYSSGASFAFKPGASVAVARRGGTTASFDAMNKYFGICQMPVVGSTYWNQVHGAVPGEAEEDAEGLQTMRNLARKYGMDAEMF